MAKQRNKVAVAVAEEQQAQMEQLSPEHKPTQECTEEIAKLAYHLWQARGCPDGSPEEDWLAAEREMLNAERKGSSGEKSKPFLV